MSATHAVLRKKPKLICNQQALATQLTLGPEAEFFVFDDVRFATDPYNTGFKLDSDELPSNMDTEYAAGNMGHRPRTKGGYFPVPPIDQGQDYRSEMLLKMKEMGITVEKASPRSGCCST